MVPKAGIEPRNRRLRMAQASLNSREAFEFSIPFTRIFPRFFEYGRPVEPG
jgi:hypothetical protein